MLWVDLLLPGFDRDSNGVCSKETTSKLPLGFTSESS